MPSNITNVALLVCLLAGSALLPGRVAGQTPEQSKVWEAERIQRQAEQKARAEQLLKQRAARKADPMAWVKTLNPILQGGWQFRAVAPDGSWAAFSTEHQLKRSGHLVTVWVRQEYPEVQHNEAGEPYLSDVEKIEYDCVKERGRPLLIIYFAENNIGGTQQSEENDPKQTGWDAIVPGTQSDALYQWTCSAAAKLR